MRTIIGLFLLASFSAHAERKMTVIQAYELEGSDPAGYVAASISLLNVSEVPQTVKWSGGIIPNRTHNGGPGPHDCSPHSGPQLPPHSKASDYDPVQKSIKLAPDGFVTLWCSSNTGTTRSPGHEGVIKVDFTVEEDRGAVMGSGSIHVHDRGSSFNWGGSGAGPFLINGGRAF